MVDYLIFKGVDPAQLRAIGYGQEKPIADNQTDEGKFKNRRIEFEVLNTDSGVVREVDDRGVEKVN
ncbi:Outer membrane porin F precursor [compost metagenome]